MDSTFIRGSVSGLITCTLVQPLDVMKTTIITHNKSFTLFDSIHYINQRFGVKGFWRGMQPAGYKAFIGSGMTFSYLEALKAIVPASISGFTSNSAIGMISRGLTIVSLAPLSIVKVRMEAAQGVGYASVSEGLYKIYAEEGVKGYYKGLSSCLLRDLPFSGLSYGFYQLFSTKIAGILGYSEPELPHKTVGAIIAGFTATILTQPFDIIKTRTQFSHLSDSKEFDNVSLFSALKKIYQKEGIQGFTIGLRIRLIERSSGFAIVWFIYEELKQFSVEVKS
jgi:solute carrier family 25, member 38